VRCLSTVRVDVPNGDRLWLRRRGIPALGAVAVLAALAAPAEARLTRFGSALSAPANFAEAHGADSVFWGISLPGSRRTRVQASGQIRSVRLKGIALPSSLAGAPPPLTEFHLQTLRPRRDGSVRVRLTSQPFNIPSSGDPNRISTYKPINLCAKKGDYVAFNDEGGFNPPWYLNGVSYQVFSRVRGSSMRFYTKDNGTNNGATFRGRRHRGQELLMQMVLATGGHASPPCR
jgi:hypothetical protein